MFTNMNIISIVIEIVIENSYRNSYRKAFEKIQHPFMTKTQQTSKRRELVQPDKIHLKKASKLTSYLTVKD